MVGEVALAVIMACPSVTFQNKTSEWTQQDISAYKSAVKRCPELHPDAPCVTVFRKVEAGIYSVVCGYKKPLRKRQE